MVWTGCRMPKRRAAIIASQQQPQQLQMKPTSRARSRRTARGCRSWAWCSRSSPSAASTAPRVAVPRASAAVPLKVMQMSSGASQARPDVLHLVPAVAEADARLWTPCGSPRSPARSRGRAATFSAGSAGSCTNARPSCVSPRGEEVPDEVLLDVEVLVEELGQHASGRRRRAAASSRTRRSRPWAAGGRRAAPPSCSMSTRIARVASASSTARASATASPGLRRRRGEGLDRQLRDELRLRSAEEDLEDAVERSEGGAPCGKRFSRSARRR